jgi:YD repeat-containing protein
MKNLLLITAILLMGCSNNDSSTYNDNDSGGVDSPNDAPLVLSILSTDSENSSYIYSDIYTYDGNKLKSVTQSDNQSSSISTYYFVYTNNKVIRIDGYTSYNASEPTKTEEVNYSYDSQGRLASMVHTDSYETETGTFTYNANGSVTYNQSYKENNSPISTENPISLQFDSKDNLISFSDGEGTRVLAYDNYKSPFKNVVGLNFHILLSGELTTSEIFSLNNNCTSASFSNAQGETFSDTYSYDYNQEGYPRQIIAKDYEGYESTITIQYSN